ncbi:MAG TPA: hypothetical protein VKY37_07665 [Brumimicrobium sp.]|nr:hypothetical protein [Brumimicrobium sp.]
MEVKPRIGIENIKFGMNRTEIVTILGEPDQVIEDTYDEGEYRLEWNELKLRLTFQAEDRFTYYSSKYPNLMYKGQVFMDENIDKIKADTFGDLKSDWEIDDFETFKTHFEESIFLTLHSEYGKVSTFELGVPFKNETEFDWPL